ncbi:haloacid dehalogenase [Desulfoluna limicola]|uniref:Haloacid dehalogenase n=1 Tax=Desulfoluna limicola TaxID=2810562 RepID=A0ABM7PJF7_9BACT|nr:HAD family hydrolase [Desulfoluna limicola]BCS97532.1 haloacid dehalogenase [Desulfoluna limicola]
MTTETKKQAILFDWGNTLMRVFEDETGPMASWSRIELLPGVRESLELLSGRYTLVLATKAADSDEVAIREALLLGGISPFIDRIFCRKNTGVAKPAPAFYLKILEELALPPSACLMVGDTLEDDVLAPRRLGMHGVHLSQSGEAPALTDWPVIHHFEELAIVAAQLLEGATAR